MISFAIGNGRGSKSTAEVDSSGALVSTVRPLPPYVGLSVTQKMRALRQHLTTDGAASDGTNQDMRVDGSSTNVDFYIAAHAERDRYVCLLSFAIVDASASLNKFGNITALTNGCNLFYSDDRGDVTIHNALKSNFNFIRLCAGEPAFGDAAGAFLANNVVGTSEGYIPVLDFRRTFGFQWGVLLAGGTSQRITLRVRDNIPAASVDQFDCIAYGFERLPD